jgi:hypothetical protein
MDWSWLNGSAAVAWKNGGQALFGGVVVFAWGKRKGRDSGRTMRYEAPLAGLFIPPDHPTSGDNSRTVSAIQIESRKPLSE